MPEAEISPTGTVLVEGHHVGELQGFRFTVDQSAGGEDAKAVRTAAQKALATEFEARAERFGVSANGDIALGSDGTLRWIGAPIGTLVAGEDALKPRLVLLADEQLTGPPRDKVAARAERFVNFQIDQLLKPLVDLKNAEQVTGIARGIAFQLVEHFGLLNRRDIAEEMRSLDQEGRAALRRLGVRFGAYHVFVPSLIKPAPAGLVTLLWALKNDGKDQPGFGDVVHALASGRTSVVIDPIFEKTFYKLAGYRNLGRRAVRVDILERLADLIRPATNWKPGLGPRPDGAYDGSAFMVTPPMMSILGATADDMEEILKGLGYRAEPKPAAEVKARLEAQDKAAQEAAEAKAAADAAREAAKAAQDEIAAATAQETGETPADGSAPATEAPAAAPAEVSSETPAQPQSERVAEAHSAAEPSSEAAAPSVKTEEAPAAPEAAPAEAPVESAKTATAPVEDVVPDAASEEAPVETAPAATASAPDISVETTEGPAAQSDSDVAPTVSTDAAEPVSTAEAEPEAEEPKPILLWRQARFDRQRGGQRHDHRRDNRPRGQRTPQPSGTQADAQRLDNAAAERPAHEGRREQRDGAGKPRFDRSRYKKPQGSSDQGSEGGDRRDGRPGWKGGKRHEGKGGGQGNGKPAFQAKPREERPARFDPDSPFAKLAALRDQLKK